MSIYENYLIVLVVAYVAVLVKEHLLTPKPTKSDNEHGSSVFKRFQREFLAVYLTMMAADWMQGPYVYQLYSYYGFTRQENGILFIAGFGSSLIFGTWAGPIADLYGRKFTCMLYGVTYALSCMTKHINNFEALMVGRLLGGFATSILWSAFESWMVSEHGTRDFPADGMSSTFSLMTAMNGFVAIASGFVAQWAVDIVGSPVAPFDVSALFLVGGTAFIYFSWVENYGSLTKSMMEQMKEALQEVKSDTRIALVGLQQSLFEGAMYTFVFMWTPSLARDKTTVIPHGLIFAAFMIACSLGGTLFGVVSAALPCHTLLLGVFVGSALCMAVPIFTEEPFYIFGAFVGFELLVGLFWPAIGTLRSRLVPEHCRATVMNLFRVPLNIIVCGVLYFQGSMDVSRVFIICSFFHFAAAAAALALASALNAPQTNGRRTLDMTGATTVLH